MFVGIFDPVEASDLEVDGNRNELSSCLLHITLQQGNSPEERKSDTVGKKVNGCLKQHTLVERIVSMGFRGTMTVSVPLGENGIWMMKGGLAARLVWRNPSARTSLEKEGKKTRRHGYQSNRGRGDVIQEFTAPSHCLKAFSARNTPQRLVPVSPSNHSLLRPNDLNHEFQD